MIRKAKRVAAVWRSQRIESIHKVQYSQLNKLRIIKHNRLKVIIAYRLLKLNLRNNHLSNQKNRKLLENSLINKKITTKNDSFYWLNVKYKIIVHLLLYFYKLRLLHQNVGFLSAFFEIWSLNCYQVSYFYFCPATFFTMFCTSSKVNEKPRPSDNLNKSPIVNFYFPSVSAN